MSNTQHAHARFELDGNKIKVDIEGSEENIAKLIASSMLKDDDVKGMITKALILCALEKRDEEAKEEFEKKIDEILKQASKYQA